MYNAMIVDDEPRTIDALEKNIDWRTCGIRKIYKAESMQNAINNVQENKIDIIICDIEMPNGSGLQLLEWLNTNKYKVSCIFVTCHPEFDYMRKAIQLKCYDYILKPINYSEFTRIIKELVRKMEALEDGKDKDKAINWGGITDQDINDKNVAEKDRDVEKEVKRYISEHMMDNISVTNIADALHFNSQYLMRAFKKKTDMSIVEYITNIRMDTAKKILGTTDLAVKEVAGMVGYADYAYFTRVFKKETGQSPNQYRNSMKKL